MHEKTLREIQNRVKNYLAEGRIQTKQKPEFVDFFLSHSINFLTSARAEYKLSTNPKESLRLGFSDYNGLIVVVNSSYYSMFNMARALLESSGIKIRTELSIHSVTYDALVHFFLVTRKLEKKLIESFSISMLESAELMGRDRAGQIMQEYLYEKKKRAMFTYKMGSNLVQAKAKTSLDRAIGFSDTLRGMIE